MLDSAPTTPEREGRTEGETGRRLGAFVFAGLLLALGLFSAYYPTLLSGFRQVQPNPGDPRLLTYVLEHGFRWLTRWPLHEGLWAPPFYFPTPDAGAFTDVLLGMGPLYWIWRWLGMAPDTAYQAFTLGVATLNFVAGYAFVRVAAGASASASAAGAFLFAFANSRTAHVLHQQVMAGYLPVLAVLCLVLLFRAESLRERRIWTGLFFACWVVQMWSAFYWAWYLVFCLFLAAVWAVASPRWRPGLVRTLRETGWAIPVAAVGAVLLTLPLVLAYLGAASQVGFRDFDIDVLPHTARLASWLYMGTPNLVYGLLQGSPPFQALPGPVEQQLGVGLVTTAVALWGLWAHRTSNLVRLLAVVGITLVVLSTVFPGGVAPWRWVHAVFPGAGAIRAPARSGVVLLLPLALGFGLALSRLEGRGRFLLAAALLAVCAIEQVRYQPSYDKLEARAQAATIRDALPSGCATFYMVNRAAPGARLAYEPWKYHLDAMSAQLDLDIPTVNGYSGLQPSGWRPLYVNTVRTDDDEARLRAALDTWLEGRGAPACMVEVSLP